jgi:hypothetical protein
MPLIAAAETARATRRRASSNGAGFWHSTYLGANRYRPEAAPPPEPGQLYPMAFLVEQDAGSTVGAHFHQADQFQVLVAGTGMLGTHAVAPVTVHFAAAHSAYGPVRAGTEGLSYFTLRNGWDPGARYMPGARGELPRPRHHREAVASPIPLPEVPIPSPAVPRREAVLPAEADGLAAWHDRLPAGAALAGPDPAGGAGQYWLVLAGSLIHDGTLLPPRSCLFVAPDEPPLAATAGPLGTDLLALQFPHRAGTAHPARGDLGRS